MWEQALTALGIAGVAWIAGTALVAAVLARSAARGEALQSRLLAAWPNDGAEAMAGRNGEDGRDGGDGEDRAAEPERPRAA